MMQLDLRLIYVPDMCVAIIDRIYILSSIIL